MSKFSIHSCTLEAAIEVASNLRSDDLREVVEGHGVDPMVVLPLAIHDRFCVHFTAPNGKTAGMGGVGEDGRVWMVCTPVIHDYPIAFYKLAKQVLYSRPEKLLWNIVDKRNTVHLRLLKKLGFKFLREIPYGPNKLSFIEFCRVLRSPSQSRQ